jgi:hypothetical protein
VKERCAQGKNGPTAPVPRCQTVPGPMCGLGCRTGVGQPTEPPILAGGGWQPAWECLPHLGVRLFSPSLWGPEKGSPPPGAPAHPLTDSIGSGEVWKG